MLKQRNVFWSALDYAVVPLGMLVATPVFIGYLGLEQFGVLVLVSSLIGVSSLLNFGFGDTALKYVSHCLNLGERTKAISIVRTIGILVFLTGFITAVGFALSAPFLVKVFNINTVPNAVDVFYLTALIIPMKMLESVYVAVLRGCYRYDLAGRVTVTAKIMIVFLQVLLVIGGQNLLELLLVTLGVVVASNLLLFGLGCANLGNITPFFYRASFNEIRHFSLWSWMQGVAGLIYSSVDRLMIAAMLGPTALGVYGVCIQLAQNIHYGLSAASHSIFPRISMLNSGKEEDEGASLRKLYLSATRIISVAAVLVGSLMAVFSYQILEVWVGQEIAEDGYILLALLSISFGWFSANSIVTYYTLNGLGKAKLQAGVSVGSASLMAISCAVFLPVFGLVGAAVARFPDAIFRLGVRIYLSRNIIGGISKWASFDFIRITLFVTAFGVALRELLIWFGGSQLFFLDPINVVVVIISSILLFIIVYRIECMIKGDEPSAANIAAVSE